MSNTSIGPENYSLNDGVGAALLCEQGQLLLVRTRRNPDHWGYVGGGVEAGDANLVAAIQRELREETGVELPLKAFEFQMSVPLDKIEGLAHFYTAHLALGISINLDTAELIEYRWVTIEEALMLPLFLATRESIRYLALSHLLC